MDTLGSRLKKLREQNSLTQKEAAKKFGIANFQLSRYENDLSNPDPDLIAKFAIEYDVTTDFLILGSKKSNKIVNYNNSSDKNIIKTNDGMEINLDDLTDYQQAILEYALSKDEVSFEKKPADVLEMLARFEAFYLMEKELNKKSKDKK